MEFSFLHNCITVKDLDRSIKFYKEVLGLIPKRRLGGDDITLVYMGDAAGSRHELELCWRPNKEGSYELGNNEFHLAFEVDDYAAALEFHKKLGCVKNIKEEDSVYFIADPDGYVTEILPRNHFSQNTGLL